MKKAVKGLLKLIGGIMVAAGAFFLFLGGQRPGIDVLIDCHRLLLPCQIWCSRLTLS